MPNKEPKNLDYVLNYFYNLGKGLSFNVFNHEKYTLYWMEGHPSLKVVIRTTYKSVVVDFSDILSRRLLILPKHTKESIEHRLEEIVTKLCGKS